MALVTLQSNNKCVFLKFLSQMALSSSITDSRFHLNYYDAAELVSNALDIELFKLLETNMRTW